MKLILSLFSVITPMFFVHAEQTAQPSKPVGLDSPPKPVGLVSPSFKHEIGPLLSDRCYKCHGPGKKKGGLRLDRRDDALDSLSLDDLDASEFLYRITTDDPDDRMPPGGKAKPLTEDDVKKLTDWMKGGAPYETHWAYIKPKQSPVPDGQNPVDYFVGRKLSNSGLPTNNQAESAVLLRRLYLDLIGLPPTIEELEDYLSDKSPDRYERTVDRLLASPHYGEKWARQWLDLARYADSSGFQHDKLRTNWPYRDWVIRALNKDMPFDQFSIDQLAGDLLPNPTVDQLVATALHRHPPANLAGGSIPDEVEVQIKMDRVNTTGLIWLGATMECAACHDHRFDPISQEDYFRLYAYFDKAEPEISRGKPDGSGKSLLGPTVMSISESDRRWLGQLRKQQAQIVQWLNEKKPSLDEQQVWLKRLWQEKRFGELQKDPFLSTLLKKSLRKSRSQKKPPAALTPQLEKILLLDHPDTRELARKKVKIDRKIKQLQVLVNVMGDRKEPVETRLFKRGNYLTPGQIVEPGGLSVLHEMPEDLPRNRLGMAKWLVSKENPLTARVTVNRWWGEIFGIGIVQTQEDFGHQAAKPSHPELLDWLAVEFMDRGWSMKHILKLIVLSETYRRDAAILPEHLSQDPKNRLLARGSRQRLPAEAIRDNALSIAGLLSQKQFGPPIYPPQPVGLWDEIRGVVAPEYRVSQGENRYRRGLYIVIRRGNANPSLLNFDATSRPMCITHRRTTNTPMQALTLLNDPVFVEAAEAFAQLIIDHEGTLDEKLDFAFRRAISREPTSSEMKLMQDLYQGDPTGFDLAQVLINLDETITK